MGAHCLYASSRGGGRQANDVLTCGFILRGGQNEAVGEAHQPQFGGVHLWTTEAGTKAYLVPASPFAPDPGPPRHHHRSGPLAPHHEAGAPLDFRRPEPCKLGAMVKSNITLGATTRAGEGCGCGRHAVADPELDARAIPPTIRHGAIFGALDSVQPGYGVVIVAPHDPVPLIAQVAERFDGAFSVEYLERGPEAWRIRFGRSA